MKLLIVRSCGSAWADRAYHPGGSGTIDLRIARTFWPHAEVIAPSDPRWAPLRQGSHRQQ